MKGNGEKEIPFLGIGHYFWDDNIDTAKWWGKKFLKNEYYVVQSTLSCNSDIFFDLVGNRQHMKWLIRTMNELVGRGVNRKNWTLGVYFEFIKKMSEKDPSAFPYKMIRAADISGKAQRLLYYFVEGKPNFTDLNPRLVVCVIEKNVAYLKPCKIVFQS